MTQPSMNPITKFLPMSNFNWMWECFNNLSSPPDPRTSRTWPIREAVVKSVDWEDYTCTVTDDSGATHDKVRCISSWFSSITGFGINFCPESYSHVLITKGPGLEWFIIGFAPSEQLKEENKPDTYYKNYRPDIMEGDMHFSTEAGNFIFIRKTAHSIRIENTPACFIDMQATSNYIHIGCQNLLLQTKSCMVTMRADDPETVEDENGKTKAKPVDVCTTGFFRTNTGDYKNFIKIDIGKVKLNNPDVEDNIILSLNICDKAGITIDTDGNIKSYTNGDGTYMSKGNVVVASKNGGINFKSKEDIKFDTEKSVHTTSGKDIIRKAASKIQDEALGGIEHVQGNASPDMNAPYPAQVDNSNNAQNKPFSISGVTKE